MMGSYQAEQLEALSRVRLHLAALARGEKEKLLALAADYLAFRHRVDEFQDRNFGNVCDRTCYQNHLSACCSREGIVTFFADVVINLLASEESEVEGLAKPMAASTRVAISARNRAYCAARPFMVFDADARRCGERPGEAPSAAVCPTSGWKCRTARSSGTSR